MAGFFIRRRLRGRALAGPEQQPADYAGAENDSERAVEPADSQQHGEGGDGDRLLAQAGERLAAHVPRRRDDHGRDRRDKAHEQLAHGRDLAPAEISGGQDYHQYKGRQDRGRGRESCAGTPAQAVTHVGTDIDRDRAGQHRCQRDTIQHLTVREQFLALHHHVLDHRDHGHEAAETGAGDAEKNPEQRGQGKFRDRGIRMRTRDWH
jgi:hypothetical protein